MLTPPPRRAWGTRFDSLVDTAMSPSSRNADPDMTAEKERPEDSDRAYPSSSLSAPTTTSGDTSPLPARMPHDASVFVASLPSHIPEQELQAQLTAHLSQHASIKHIKLIRDNRGAVCAFVQVESAAQATNLIAACNLSLFMDRHIRCEVARAFRTLLVSWKAAVPSLGSATNAAAAADNTGRALRLRRCKGSRYIQVSLGADALQADIAHLPNYSFPRVEDPLSGSGVFFSSGLIEGDFQALKGLLEAFGPLEFITPFEPMYAPVNRSENGFVRGDPGPAAKQDDRDNASTGDAPRPMWAAKWEHRNDAVSAITALQLVPNLFICWSHTYGRLPYTSNFAPRGYSETQSHGSSGMHTPSYPPASFQGERHSYTDQEGQWAPRLQQLHAQALASDGSKSQEPLGFSESDFPPLRVDAAAHMLGGRGRGKRGAWVGRKTFVRAGAPSPPPISTSVPAVSRLYDPTSSNTPTSGAPNTPDLDSVVEPSPITPGFPITPRTPSGGYAPAEEVQKDSTSVTPSCPGFQQQQRRNEDCLGDGRELFVGGLDAITWDEERVHNVFGRFGALEEVSFVRPGPNAPPFKRAFAFIKFAQHEASQKAIEEEHLRVYDDRRIKVQLREAAGRRWSYRGRGRFHHVLLRTDRGSLDFDHDFSADDAAEGRQVQDATGHVRFASVPNGASMHMEAHLEVQKDKKNLQRDVPKIKTEDIDEGFIDNPEPRYEVNPVHSSTTSSTGSDCIPDASMEAQPSSADTTVTLADVTISPPQVAGESTQQEQSEQDTYTAVSSTPPPSNPDAVSTYAPSSEGSAPTSTGYYPTVPSWIPPYAIPHAPYGPYGYYPQQISGQSNSEASATYPWMAALYRNVVPFVPWFNPPPGVELAAPPVRPTGYIQRDPGGIFIPVYPPERLGQYMSTSGAAVDQAQPQGHASSVPPVNWQNIPPHAQLYPMPFPMQQAMMMQQQAATAAAQQQQLPMTGNSWITGHPPGSNYLSQQQAAPSSAPPPYPTPNAFFQTPSSTATPHARQGMYGPYDPALQHTQKPLNRRNGEYGSHQPRFLPREGRATAQRRGPGVMMHTAEQSFGAGNVDSQFAYAMKPNGAQAPQPVMTPSGSHGSEWNWNAQSR